MDYLHYSSLIEPCCLVCYCFQLQPELVRLKQLQGGGVLHSMSQVYRGIVGGQSDSVEDNTRYQLKEEPYSRLSPRRNSGGNLICQEPEVRTSKTEEFDFWKPSKIFQRNGLQHKAKHLLKSKRTCQNHETVSRCVLQQSSLNIDQPKKLAYYDVEIIIHKIMVHQA